MVASLIIIGLLGIGILTIFFFILEDLIIGND